MKGSGWLNVLDVIFILFCCLVEGMACTLSLPSDCNCISNAYYSVWIGRKLPWILWTLRSTTIQGWWERTATKPSYPVSTAAIWVRTVTKKRLWSCKLSKKWFSLCGYYFIISYTHQLFSADVFGKVVSVHQISHWDTAHRKTQTNSVIKRNCKI